LLARGRRLSRPLGSDVPTRHFILNAKIVVVEVLSAIVFFKWLLKAFFPGDAEMISVFGIHSPFTNPGL
jgi:hypothetical protein